MNSVLFSLQVSTVCTVRLVYIIFLSSPNGLYASYKKFPCTYSTIDKGMQCCFSYFISSHNQINNEQ